jgi:hypothetical protein
MAKLLAIFTLVLQLMRKPTMAVGLRVLELLEVYVGPR